MLYGLSLVLEFAALIALRIRQPELPRPYRIPGGVLGAVGVSIAPVAIAGWALMAARDEQIVFGTLKIPVLLFGLIVLLMGMLVYWPVRSRLP